MLHSERLDGRRKRLDALPNPAETLPDGTMVLLKGAPHLMRRGRAHAWSPAGYGGPAEAPEAALVITPPSVVATLMTGYRPELHPSAVGSATTRSRPA